jgi:hypothetical protein
VKLPRRFSWSNGLEKAAQHGELVWGQELPPLSIGVGDLEGLTAA